MTCFLLSTEAGFLVLSLAICALAAYLSDVPAERYTKNLKAFGLLLLFTFLIHVLMTPGDAVLTLPFTGIAITDAGLANGLRYAVRFGLLITMAAVLSFTTTPVELSDAVEKLFSPLKRLRLPVREFAFMLTLTIRFIPILLTEAERIKHAQLSRGLRFDRGGLERVKNVLPMVIPLFVSSIRRAEDLAVAMEARGYHGGEGRTMFKAQTMSPADYQVLAVAGFGACALLFFRFWG